MHKTLQKQVKSGAASCSPVVGSIFGDKYQQTGASEASEASLKTFWFVVTFCSKFTAVIGCVFPGGIPASDDVRGQQRRQERK